MYGMTLSGKYWWLDLLEFLLSIGFKPSKSVPCLFIFISKEGKIYVLNYVDDMLYFETNEETTKWFKQQLNNHFNLEFLDQAHWYLATRINQLANFDIELDQSHYCLAIVKRYLDTPETKKVLTAHTTPLPSDFIPSTADCSQDEAKAKQLALEYNIDYASCIGSLIYLGMTRVDIVFAVNKLAKFTHRPGKAHFKAVLHLLRYLRDNIYLGLKFYSEISDSPIIHVLHSNKISQDIPSLDFQTHHGMMTLILELEGINEQDLPSTTIYFDSRSAIAMGDSYRDTKHTRHILRCYHYVRESITAK